MLFPAPVELHPAGSEADAMLEEAMTRISLGKFGSLIRERRRQLDMKQEEVARRVGASPSYIANLEAGIRRPSEKLVTKIADVLGLKARELFLYTIPKIANFLSVANIPDEGSAWDRFPKDEALREAYKITDQEVKILSRLAMMGEVRALQDSRQQNLDLSMI